MIRVMCRRCGHPREAHILGAEHRCRTRIAYDWDERRKTFNRTCPCLCPGYLGAPVELGPGGCPHEYAGIQAGCVHCGHVPSYQERSS
jgi:hypothetical protein